LKNIKYILGCVWLVTALAMSSWAQSCTSATCTAASTSESDFLAALPASGNTHSTVVVNVPSGTSGWTGNITYTIPAAVTDLTIQGATNINCTGTAGTSGYACSAVDNTVIQDSYAINGPSIFKIITGSSGTHFRMTGLTIEGGSIGVSSNNKYGVIIIGGSTENLRFDHNHINNNTYSPATISAWVLVSGSVVGVMDHNIVDLGSNTSDANGFLAFNTVGDGVGNGDGTWAAASQWGSLKFLFMESNIFNGGYSDDCTFAGRFVSRYNYFNNNTSAVQTHATKSSAGPERGCRAFEVYHNYITRGSPGDAPIGTKVGTGLVWGNTLAAGTYYNFFAAVVDRSAITVEDDTPTGWGYCGTTNPNDTSGHTSGWDGNDTGGYPCLDSVGRGQTLQSLNGANFPGRLNSSTGSIAWPHQYFEPVYLWNNTIVGGSGNLVSIRDTITVNGRDVQADCQGTNAGCTGTFNGSTGTGYGTLAARPSSCTPGPGGTYFTSPIGSLGAGYFATDQCGGKGELYACTSSNTWTAIYCPADYPHPLVSGTPTTATPVPSVAPGTYGSTQTVSFTDATGGASIFCTTDGTSPTSSSTPYSGAFTISSTETVQCMATASGDSDSSVGGGLYTIGLPTASAPTELSPFGGSYSGPITVTWTDSTPGASMFCTTDGSLPTTSSTPYAPFNITVTTNIRCIAHASGYLDSPSSGDTWVITGGGGGGGGGGGVVSSATGDTRTISEPTFPAVCATLQATKYIASTTSLNIDPYNSTCGSTGGSAGTLGCTGGTSYEPSSTSGSYTSSESLDNSALTSALSSCPSGQAVELVPGSGGQLGFVLAPFSIPSGKSIILDAGIHVFASRNRTDYGGTNCGVVTSGSSSCNHWITAASTTGSGIYGYGVFDGRGWDAFVGSTTSGFYANRVQAYCNNHGGAINGSPACTVNGSGNNSFGPNGLNLVGATNFTLYKTTIKDSGNFIFNWQDSNGLVAWGAKLIAPFEVSNTDGFDPLNSQNGTFTHGVISNGDNHVAVKAKTGVSQNITVSNTQTGAGIALALGTDQAAGISNVLFTDIVQRGNLFNTQSAGLQIGSSTANGGAVDIVTFRNVCMVDEKNSIRVYTNYGGLSGSSTPVYTNVLFQNIHVLPSTAPYTTGNSGTFTFQGLSGNPIGAQLDNIVIDGTNEGVASQSGVTLDQYANIHLGPGAVASSLLSQFSAGTSVVTGGSAGSSTPYGCTTSTWKPLVGELNLKAPSGNNNQSYSGSGPITLQAVLQPATEISTEESPALTASVTFLDNGVSIGTAPLLGDGSFATFLISSPPSGTHVYTARYPGDSNYSAFTFGSVSVTSSGGGGTTSPNPPVGLLGAATQ
jgi:hypothetical protein